MSSTIIVVEDHSTLTPLFSEKLINTGYFCIPAESASSALDLLESIPPDAVIIDLELPNSEQILRFLHQNARFDDTVTIVITRQTHEDARIISRYQPQFVVIKPVSPRELMLLVNHELSLNNDDDDDDFVFGG